MSVHRFRVARTAGGLALATAVALAGGAARAQAGPVQTGPAALDRMLRAQAKAAVAAFNHDMTAGGMAHVRSRKDACWAELSRMSLDPVDPAEAKAAYCAAYEYVAHFVDGAVAKQLQRPPSPGFEQAAVIAEIRDGLLAAQCPPESVDRLAGLIVSRALEELDRSARQ